MDQLAKKLTDDLVDWWWGLSGLEWLEREKSEIFEVVRERLEKGFQVD